METEVWKDIPWYDKYKISNLWRIKSKDYKRTWKEKILCLQSDKWYMRLKLMVWWIEKLCKIHRLVAQAFIPNPNNYPVVMHLDNNPSNNRVENLKWWTFRDNTQQCWIEWRSNNNLKYRNPNIWRIWILHKDSKIVNQFDLQWNFIRKWYSTMDIQRELWFANTWISACARWKFKTAKWFIWKYE